EIVVEDCTAQPRHGESPLVARMTAGKRPSGRSPWLRAIREGASRTKRRAGSNIRKGSVLLAEMLGAPGGSGAAHIVQFRAVGIERLGDELAPEGAELCEGFFQSVAAVRRGVQGCRT